MPKFISKETVAERFENAQKLTESATARRPKLKFKPLYNDGLVEVPRTNAPRFLATPIPRPGWQYKPRNFENVTWLPAPPAYL